MINYYDPTATLRAATKRKNRERERCHHSALWQWKFRVGCFACRGQYIAKATCFWARDPFWCKSGRVANRWRQPPPADRQTHKAPTLWQVSIWKVYRILFFFFKSAQWNTKTQMQRGRKMCFIQFCFTTGAELFPRTRREKESDKYQGRER